MGFWRIAFLIIAALACGSAALAGGGGRGTSHGGVAGVAGPSHSNGAKHFFIVRAPLPIRQAPASTDTARFGTSRSQVDSWVDSRF
jgi:hypothetical protein